MARSCSTICLPIGKDAYLGLVEDPRRFRGWLAQAFRSWPELFPKDFASGYRLKDRRRSAKTGLRLRRVRLRATGQAFSVRPSFVLPYQTGAADQVQGPLFLRAFGVPFWALAQVFGKDAMYWYRLEVSLGRNSVVGSPLEPTRGPSREPLSSKTPRSTSPWPSRYLRNAAADSPWLTKAKATWLWRCWA